MIPTPRSDLGVSKGYHSSQIDVRIRLNTNESPFPPPAELLERWSELVTKLPLNRYPDRHAIELCKDIARFHNVSSDMVFVANGSNEVLLNLLLSYGGKGAKALSFEPTYAMYETISRMTSTSYVALERDADFLIEARDLLQRVDEVDPEVIFLCQPNNPTGIIESDEILDILTDRGKSLIVVDEAYGQFCQESSIGRVNENENLVVVRTFSKIWALAGMRIGYCIANKEIIDVLWNVTLPYHLDMSKALLASLSFDYVPEMETRVSMLIHERERVSKELAVLGFTVWPSGTNFVLFRPNGVDGSKLWHRLVQEGILIRDWTSWPRLDNCLRVTIGTEYENDQFLAALSNVF